MMKFTMAFFIQNIRILSCNLLEFYYTLNTINKYRINKSIEIFIDNKGTLKIKELGELVGYTNTITYINNFKKVKNVTPTAFLEKYLKTKNY